MDKKIIPAADRAYLTTKGYHFREISDGASNGLIIDNFPVLPEGKFTVKASSLMILLPQGYPDTAPDMFYFSPTLLIAGSNGFPNCAHTSVGYFNIQWQCWSRHASPTEWRPGVDGVHSYIQRVIQALKITI